MAVVITIEQVREFLGADYASVPDSTINTYICLVNKLDDCLDLNYPADDCTQSAIKLNAISHFTAMSVGRYLKSQHAPSGASRSFDYFTSAEGIKMTNYGRMIAMLDTAGCFEAAYPQGDQFASGAFGRTCRTCR